MLLGHGRSVWLKFTGGKSVATGLGVLVAISWPVGLGAVTVFGVALAVFRIVSLGSILAALTAIALICGLQQPMPYRLLVIAGGIYVIMRHRACWPGQSRGWVRAQKRKQNHKFKPRNAAVEPKDARGHASDRVLACGDRRLHAVTRMIPMVDCLRGLQFAWGSWKLFELFGSRLSLNCGGFWTTWDTRFCLRISGRHRPSSTCAFPRDGPAASAPGLMTRRNLPDRPRYGRSVSCYSEDGLFNARSPSLCSIGIWQARCLTKRSGSSDPERAP